MNAGSLTVCEVASIHNRLRCISDTWADLWALLYYLQVKIGRIIALRYTDIVGERLVLRGGKGRFEDDSVFISPSFLELLRRRKCSYPDDIFIFQSHSNRVKTRGRPVTVIAFNAALKRAADGVTNKKVSSKSVMLK